MSRLQQILALPKVTHNLVQGTPPWDQFRLDHRGASEAAAALGLSKKMMRSELLHMKHTGIAREFGDWLQKNVLDKGHHLEALARPHIEGVIGEDLYPVTCSRGLLSASCDGLTMDDRIAMEHKQWNETLAAMVGSGTVPEEHMPQCQQILLVTGAEELIFVVSDGTPDQMVWVRVKPDHAWWERIVAAWDQFDTDLAEYEPRPAAAPAAVGRAPESLPALRIEVTGMVTASNLDAFKEHALAVFRGINRALSTDADFADAEKTVKWCGEVEDRLKAAKQHALSQTESIDALFRTIDEISGEARTVRLDLDRLVKAEKERRRGEIVAGGVKALADHVASLNVRLGKPYMPQIPADFGGCIKGMKSLASMEDKVATELARAKIHAHEVADRIDANLKALRELASEHATLFPDTPTLVLKPQDDCRATITSRIGEHRQAEERRAAELAEKERARIRQEEEARARATAAREQQEREAAERRQREEQEGAARAEQQRQQEVSRAVQHLASLPPAAPHTAGTVIVPPAANVHPMPTRAPAAPSTPTLKLGEIKARLAPLEISAAGLGQLGFKPAAREGASVLFHEADFPQMVEAMRGLLAAALRKQQQAA